MSLIMKTQVLVLIVGYIKASEVPTILCDMGYYSVQSPYYDDIFHKVSKSTEKEGLLKLDEFIKVHNTIVEMVSQ